MKHFAPILEMSGMMIIRVENFFIEPFEVGEAGALAPGWNLSERPQKRNFAQKMKLAGRARTTAHILG